MSYESEENRAWDSKSLWYRLSRSILWVILGMVVLPLAILVAIYQRFRGKV